MYRFLDDTFAVNLNHVKKQLQILLSTMLFIAFSMHAIMPLVSHSMDTAYSSVLFEEIEQEDVLSEKDVSVLQFDSLLVEYRLALQNFDQKVAAPALSTMPTDIEHTPPYIAFHRLKIDC